MITRIRAMLSKAVRGLDWILMFFDPKSVDVEIARSMGYQVDYQSLNPVIDRPFDEREHEGHTW